MSYFPTACIALGDNRFSDNNHPSAFGYGTGTAQSTAEVV